MPRPRRVSGTRRYDPEVLQLLAGVRFAQRAGFTVTEIKRLFYGFPSSATPAERWGALAERKISELEDLVRGAREMQAVLREGVRCACSSFAECALVDEPEAGVGRRQRLERPPSGQRGVG